MFMNFVNFSCMILWAEYVSIHPNHILLIITTYIPLEIFFTFKFIQGLIQKNSLSISNNENENVKNFSIQRKYVQKNFKSCFVFLMLCENESKQNFQHYFEVCKWKLLSIF